MTKYYTKYIEPILNGIGDAARAELEKDNFAQQMLYTIRSKRFLFMTRQSKEVFIRSFYWCVIQLYSNTRFMNPQDGFGNNTLIPNDKPKYTNIYKRLDKQTGKLDIPHRYLDIFDIKQDSVHGYICRMRRKDKYHLYIITAPDKRSAVRDAIHNVSRLPLGSIDSMFELLQFIAANSQVKSTAPKKSKEAGRGHLSLAEELWNELNGQGRILRLQEKIHDIQNTTNDKIKSLNDMLVQARVEQSEAAVDVYKAAIVANDDQWLSAAANQVLDATQKYMDLREGKDQVNCAAKQNIELAKINSMLPFEKLRNRQR